MEHLSTSYFRNLWAKNVDNLKSLCEEWNEKYSHPCVPEEVRDEIRTTIGLTNLLLSQKLKQFQGLIDDSELKRGENEITCVDLQGFWDMVYNEVEKIENSFSNLEKCQKNNWVFVQEEKVKVSNKKKFIPAIAKASISTKKHASAAQKRLAEAKLKMKERIALQKENILKNEASSAAQNINSEIFLNEDPHKTNENCVVKKEEDTTIEHNSVSSVINKYKNNQIEYSTRKNASSVKVLSSKHNTRNKTIGKNDKENILPLFSTESENKTPLSVRKGRGKAKEVIPLQCVTRSAMRARQSETKKD